MGLGLGLGLGLSVRVRVRLSAMTSPVTTFAKEKPPGCSQPPFVVSAAGRTVSCLPPPDGGAAEGGPGSPLSPIGQLRPTGQSSGAVYQGSLATGGLTLD